MISRERNVTIFFGAKTRPDKRIFETAQSPCMWPPLTRVIQTSHRNPLEKKPAISTDGASKTNMDPKNACRQLREKRCDSPLAPYSATRFKCQTRVKKLELLERNPIVAPTSPNAKCAMSTLANAATGNARPYFNLQRLWKLPIYHDHWHRSRKVRFSF